MLKNIVLRIAMLTTIWVVPLAAQSDVPIIRTTWGVRYEIPAGWEWTEFDGNTVTIQHVATKSGEKGEESSPNQFSVGGRTTPDDSFDAGWDRLDRDQRRTFPSGATARWKAGPRWDGIHYVFAGEVTIGSKVLSVSILDSRTPRIDVSVVEAAFLRVAETLRDVPESAVIYHPSLRIAVDRLNEKSWYNQFDSRNIAFRCWSNGRSGNTWIVAYPSSVVFADTRKALADVTDYFEKNRSLKIGNVQRADVPGGEVLWVEQPGTAAPFLGAVRRDGRYFFLSASIKTSDTRTCTRDALREDFLAVAKSVRIWDGN